MYRPISASSSGIAQTNSFMAKSGVNKRDLPQLLNIDNALEIQNYFITGEGGLAKRKGLEKIFEETGSDGLTMLKEWDDDTFIYGYGTNLKAYTISTNTKTSIKTDFNEAHFDGGKAGNYFMVASPQDKIGRISKTLDFDSQTTNFTAGNIITGGTSGATALILEINDSGATGTLTLGDIDGVFEDGEALSDPDGGDGNADGTLVFTYTEITNAPKARILRVIGNRCYAGDLLDARDSIQYSDIDDGTNPPFNNWNISTVPDQGDLLSYRGAGKINDILSLSKFIVVLADKGWWSFWTDIIDSGGTLKKRNNFNMYREDKVGASKGLLTDKGVFYVNSNGIHRIVQLQQENVDYSKSEELISELLGNTYFEDINFDTVDLAYLQDKNTLLVTCKKNSDSNNFIIACNIKMKNAFSFFTGMNINRFMSINRDLYGASSIANKVYRIFDGYDDDGKDIWTRFYQEISLGGLNSRKGMVGQYIHGKLSASSSLDIAYDIYDKRGQFVERKKSMTWTSDATDANIDEYGSALWGKSQFGGDSDTSGALENYAGGRCMIRNFQRLRVDITENSKVHHEINYFTILSKEKAMIRKRNLTY